MTAALPLPLANLDRDPRAEWEVAYDRLVKTRAVALGAGFGGFELATDVNLDGA